MTRLQPTSAPLWPRLLLGLGLAFLVIQLIPYGRAHSNPAVTASPKWDSPKTQLLFERACADCHSNETKWPWYSNVAPVSWLVQRHVDEGRRVFNTSVSGFGPDASEAAEEVREGKMPESTYLITHPEARLSDAERQQLIAGLEATFGHLSGQPEMGEGDEKGPADEQHEREP